MEIRQGLVNATLLGWIGVVLILFRVIGPRWAGVVAVVGGTLFLPPGEVLPRVHPAVPLLKTTVTGLAVLMGMVASGWMSRTRPPSRPPVVVRWPDLVMVGFVSEPLMGPVVRGLTGSVAVDAVDTVLYRGLTWLVPYAFARRELSDRDGPTDLLRAIAVSGLVYLPILGYEAVAGPGRYVLGLVYRIPFHAGMVERLGGYRPEGFLNNGIHLAAWMALAASSGVWLALRRTRGPGGVAGWVVAGLLLGACVLCRGMYGMILLSLGLGTIAVTVLGRTRAAIVALALVGPVYAATRMAGVWDGQTLVRLAGASGRAETVAVRIASEDAALGVLRSRGVSWGDGVNLWASDIRIASIWPDGKWIFLVWGGGAVGLALAWGALHLVPISLAVRSPRGRPTRSEALATTWGLAILSALHLIDGLHNGADFAPTALIAGSLVGVSLPAVRPELSVERERGWVRLAWLAGVVVVLVSPEMVGLVVRWVGR